MDRTRLVCKIFEILENRIYADLYEVACETNEKEQELINLLWLLDSGCDIPRDLECYIEKTLDDIGPVDPFDGTSTKVCDIVLTDISTTSDCSDAPQLTPV